MKELMLYIHIPFCERKCYYCDFVSFASNYETIDRYIKALLKEIEAKKFLANDYVIQSIYIGGGTPSSIDAKYIRFIMESIKANYNLSIDCEISIEVNPHSAIIDKLRTFIGCGINRLSFGLQSANDDELKVLGRIHTYNDFLIAYNDAIHVGFKNINVDIINGIPIQTAESYKKSLKQVLMLHTNHVSIYNLILENGTVFKSLYDKGELSLPSEDEMVKIDEVTYELTDYYRLKRYEISNYAKDGFECRHNLGYWSDMPYLGFGLNASSYIDDTRYKNLTNIYEYLDLKYDYYLTEVNKHKYYEEVKILSKEDMMSEYAMLGFRKTKGIDTVCFFNKFNEKFENIFKMPLEKYINSGFIIKENDTVYLSKKGLEVSNSILCDFLL